MNDIIVFIDNAIDRNLIMEGHLDDEFGYYPQIRIKKNNDIILFCLQESNMLISKDGVNNSIFIKNLSEIDIATFKLMCAKVKEYSENKLIECFWDFFKEDEKIPTINDLDNEDD